MLRYFREAWEMAEEKTKLIILAVLIGSIVLFSALVWILRNWRGESDIAWDQAPIEVEETANIREAIRAEEVSGVVLPLSVAARAVLDSHLDALGGYSRISSVSSYRMTGTVEFEGGQLTDIVVVKKTWNKTRATERFENGERVKVVTPEDSWIAYWQDGQLLRVEDMNALERDNQQSIPNVVSELWMSVKNNWDTRYIGQRDFNYKMTHVFEVQMNPRHSVRFMIDPDTFLDLGQEERTFETDGSLAITRRIHSDHQQWNGLMIPGKIEEFKNDKLTQTILVKNVALNMVVLDSVFARPGN